MIYGIVKPHIINRIVINTFCALLLVVMQGNVQNLDICFFKNSARAQQAIDQKRPTLLLFGGISPTRYEQDSIAETKFGFEYEDLGDVKSESDSCLKAYSKVIFEHLDRKYGRTWRKKVRVDVLFLKSIPYQQERK